MIDCVESQIGQSRCLAYCIARGLIVSFLYFLIGALSGEDVLEALLSSLVVILFAPAVIYNCKGFFGFVEIAVEIGVFVWLFVGTYAPSVPYPNWVLPSFAIAGSSEVLFIVFGLVMIAVDNKGESCPSVRKRLFSAGNIFVVIITLVGVISSVVCFKAGMREGYEGGCSVGFVEGYEAGIDDGYDSGYADGYDSGYAEGEDYGYDRGYDSGYDTGSALGSRSDESNYLAPSTSVSGSYIGNVNTGKFHRSSCGYLPYPENQVYFDSREDAIYAGYDPCQRCDP